MKTEIIYEDKDLLVIRKPAGLATQTARVGQADVVSELKNYIAASGTAEPPYLGIIHRLDQPVEGLLVFAKNRKTAAALTKQLGGQGEDCTLNKRYYAVLCGKPSEKEGELVDYIYKDMQKTGKAVIIENYTEDSGNDGGKGSVNAKDSRKKHGGNTVDPGDGRGKPEAPAGSRSGITPKKAVLQYRILQTVRTTSGEDISLADIRIETGRFHQIRAQMAHAGMALLGDDKYADEAVKACSRGLGIRTVALCAGSIAFVQPVTGERLHFETRPRSKAFSFFEL
ncbi:MAG: RluA family pseudouridine synthase [Acetatifactor sp.]|nr:RluA family pseudouridine synthase [Acetatifactor sp.]